MSTRKKSIKIRCFPNFARAFRPRAILCVYALLLLSLFTAAPVLAQDSEPEEPLPPPPDDRFGLVEAFWTPEESAELNVGWERILFYWREIQPQKPDDWNTLHVLEEWLDEARVQNRRVMGVLKNTPAWATDDDSEAGLPRGLYLPVDDPENLWANYVRRIAEYYAPLGVHDWVIWNEPDIDRGVYGFEFDGTTADYVQLLKVASIVIKEVDPEAKIHLAGVTYWHDQTYLERMLRVLVAEPDAAEHDYYFDMVSLHIYFRSESVRTIVQSAQRALEVNGLDKPIWINETNAAPGSDPLWPVSGPQFPISLDQQAWYIIQAYALGFATGTESIGVYKMLDIHLPEGGESFGILRPDQSKRPAFYAYKNTIAQLSYFEDVVIAQERPTYFDIEFAMPDGVTHVLWARTAADITVTVPATQPTAQLIDALGERVTTLEAADGMYTLQLEGAVCTPDECLVGGAPVFLVEKEPLPTVTPSPTPTDTPTPTITPSLTPLPPTATPTPLATAVPSSTPTPTPLAELQEAVPATGNGVGLWFIGIGVSLIIGFIITRIRRVR